MFKYTLIHWIDHIVDLITGEIIQQGTPLSQRHLNHMDEGILKAHERLDGLQIALVPECRLVSIAHGLSAYPQILLSRLQYGLGVAGLGNGPLGGSTMEQLPVLAEHGDGQTLTVYTTPSIVQLGSEPELHRKSDREYFLTWPDNQNDSLYIRLI